MNLYQIVNAFEKVSIIRSNNFFIKSQVLFIFNPKICTILHQKVQSVKIVEKAGKMSWSPALFILSVYSYFGVPTYLQSIIQKVNIIITCCHVKSSNAISLGSHDIGAISNKLLYKLKVTLGGSPKKWSPPLIFLHFHNLREVGQLFCHCLHQLY